MQSFSEVGQDSFAYNHVQKNDGFFLDVGSYHPTMNNNTYGLELIGWKGFLFDVDQRWEEITKKTRTSPFMLGNILDVDWRGFIEDFNVPKHIDYLSLDVDDHDHEPFSKTFTVLHRLVDAGFSFGAITVEHDAYRLGDQPRQNMRDFLVKRGYTLAVGNVSCHPGDPAWAFEDWFTGEHNASSIPD
jgi:hypothetical protein